MAPQQMPLFFSPLQVNQCLCVLLMAYVVILTSEILELSMHKHSDKQTKMSTCTPLLNLEDVCWLWPSQAWSEFFFPSVQFVELLKAKYTYFCWAEICFHCFCPVSRFMNNHNVGKVNTTLTTIFQRSTNGICSGAFAQETGGLKSGLKTKTRKKNTNI